MSLLDRLTDNRDRHARDAVLHDYARMIQAHDDAIVPSASAGQMLRVLDAMHRLDRAWKAERDDPEPYGVLLVPERTDCLHGVPITEPCEPCDIEWRTRP